MFVIDGNRKGNMPVSVSMTKKQLLAAVENVAKNRAEIARTLGLPPARITELYKGARDLTFDEGRKLIDHYALEDPSDNDRPRASEDMAGPGYALVPEFDLGYSMGGGAILERMEPKGVVPFQRDWLRGVSGGNFKDLFVARGEGDSMEPTLKDADLVLIDTSQREVRQQDRIWAVAWGDLGMIKRIRRAPGGNYRIMSDNPTVSVIDASESEIYVIGRVVWVGRRI